MKIQLVCPKFHWLIFHAEDHAEASIPGYHLRVGLWRFFERNRLDYGGDTAPGTEAKRCVTGCRITSESACQLAVPKDKVHGRHFKLTLGMQALKRIGQASDVAEVIVFLTSDAAQWITGAIIPVDGGSKLQRERFFDHPTQRCDGAAQASPHLILHESEL